MSATLPKFPRPGNWWASNGPEDSALLAREDAVVTPFIDETYAMLYEGKDIRQGLNDLVAMELKAED